MSSWHANNPVVKSIHEYVLRPKKDGTLGRRVDSQFTYYCPLYVCQACSRYGSGRQVQYRSMMDRTLCMGCWNRLKPVERRQRQLDEIGLLQRKLMRTKHANEHR